MGVYIKGMEMPKNCDSCRIMTFEDANCISVHELLCGCPIVFIAHAQGEDHRPDYCPLVEVPKHGRLIDADELKQKMHYDAFDWLVLNESDVDDAPTIIESEE